MLNFKEYILALWPKGSALSMSPGLRTDKLIDGIAEDFSTISSFIKKYRTAFSPLNTQFFDVLENEYGIVKSDQLSESFRRNYLQVIANDVLQYGSKSDIDNALNAAGFEDLKVFNNDPLIDLSVFVSSDYLCYFGDTNAYLGEPTAMCGKAAPVETHMIVNSWHEEINYKLPSNQKLWPYIFLLARAKYDWPILNLVVVNFFKAGNIKLYHDYRHGSFIDYSGNNNDGVPSNSILTDSTEGALLSNSVDEKIEVTATNDLTFSGHDFSACVRLNGIYNDNKIALAVLLEQSGVHNIPADITINSVTEPPLFRYTGSLAEAAEINPWGYGEVLPYAVSPITGLHKGSPCLGVYDDSVLFDVGHYLADNNTFADVGTEDLVCNVLFKTPPNGASSGYLAAKFISPLGYFLYFDTATYKLQFGIGTSGLPAIVSTETLYPDVWYFVSFFIDRSGYGQAYVYGWQSGSAVDVSAHAGSLVVAAPFSLGAGSDSLSLYTGNIAYVSLHKADGWLDTHLQDSLALELFYKVSGIYPQYAEDTNIAITYWNRGLYLGYLRKYTGAVYELYKVEGLWPRYEQIRDNEGCINGYLSEMPHTNYVLHCFDLGAVSWTMYNCNYFFDYVQVPEDTIGAYGLSSLPLQTYVAARNTVPTISGTGVFTISVYLKPGVKEWVRLEMFDDYYHGSYFNLTTGEIGTYYTCLPKIEGPYLNGFYRVSITMDVDVNEPRDISICPVDSDDNDECTGPGAEILVFIWGLQMEKTLVPLSLIPTDGSVVAVDSEILSIEFLTNPIDSDDSVTASAIIVPQSEGTLINPGIRSVLQLSDSADTYYSRLKIDPVNDKALIYTAVNGGSSVTGFSPMNDGQRKFIQINQGGNDNRLLVDQTVEATNTDSALSAFDKIYIGGTPSGDNLNGLIKNVIIHKDTVDHAIIGQPIVDKRTSHNDGWAITSFGGKVWLKLKDQFCSTDTLVDSTLQNIYFSVQDSGQILIYVDGYIIQNCAKLYDPKQMADLKQCAIGNNVLSPGLLSFDGYIVSVILLDAILSPTDPYGLMINSAITDNTYVLEPGIVDANKFERLKKVILQKKPLGTWCLAIVTVE